MSRRSIDSRMDRIMDRLLPPGSLARREYDLSPELRQMLDYHRAKTSGIISRTETYGEGEAFARLIKGDLFLPPMPVELAETLDLTDPLEGVGTDATAEKLADLYNRIIERHQ